MNKELEQYIDDEIKARYKTFDKGHNIEHFDRVTKKCVEYAKKLNENGENIDLDIAFIVGAFHDIGMINGRKDHAKSSGIFVRNDKILNKFYDKTTIEIIAQAVEDHSAHLGIEPRNIYGKIVSDSDRNNTVYLTFSRPLKFALEDKTKNYTKQEYLEESYNYICKKFGRNGYVKYWLDITNSDKYQQAIWDLLDNKELCFAYMSGIFDELTKGKFD